MSDEFPAAIGAAIVAVKKQIRQIGVDEKNPHGGYAYVSVDRMYQVIGPMMAEAGLALLIDEAEADIRESAKGTPWLFTRYALRVMHESGVVSPPLMRSCALPISGPESPSGCGGIGGCVSGERGSPDRPDTPIIRSFSSKNGVSTS